MDAGPRRHLAAALALSACLTLLAWAQQDDPARLEPQLEPPIERPQVGRPDAPAGVRVPVMKPNNRANPMVEMPEFAKRRQQAQQAIMEALSPERLAHVRVSGAVQELVVRLDDPSYQVREGAAEALRSQRIDDAEIWAVLDRAELSPEARERLLGIAKRRAMEKPRGALGVRMGNAPLARPGVLVQGTLPDMPAEKILKVGDVIEQVDGVQLTSSNDLAEALQTRPPGHEVKLVVLRTERDAQGRPLAGADGRQVERRLEFNVALGDASNLDRFDAMEARAMGLPNNMAMNRANLPLQQRAWQAASIAQRFASKPAPAVVPEALPGAPAPQPPVIAPPVDREP